MALKQGSADVAQSPRAIGERIRGMRTRWEWTLQQLADALGTSRQTVSHWEHGRWSPSDSAFQCLSYISGLSGEAWKTGKGFKMVDPPMTLKGYYVPGDWVDSVAWLPPINGGEVCLVDPLNEWSREILDFDAMVKKMRSAMHKRQPVWVIINE